MMKIYLTPLIPSFRIAASPNAATNDATAAATADVQSSPTRDDAHPRDPSAPRRRWPALGHGLRRRGQRARTWSNAVGGLAAGSHAHHPRGREGEETRNEIAQESGSS